MSITSASTASISTIANVTQEASCIDLSSGDPGRKMLCSSGALMGHEVETKLKHKQDWKQVLGTRLGEEPVLKTRSMCPVLILWKDLDLRIHNTAAKVWKKETTSAPISQAYHKREQYTLSSTSLRNALVMSSRKSSWIKWYFSPITGNLWAGCVLYQHWGDLGVFMLPNLAVVPGFTPTIMCRLRGPGIGQGRSNLAGTSLLLKRNCI